MEDRHSATRTISAVMAITLLGKVMGLYRDHLLAVHYGMGMEANAFYTASRIPRVFFDAVFASAIAACFIPVFSEYLEQKGKKEAYRFAGCFITIIALLTGVLTLAGMAFPQPLVALFADYEDPQTTALAISLTRTMFPTVLFSGVAFSLVGVLQAQDHFTAPALMSALSNLVIIAYFLFLDQSMGIYGLALAYLLGWFLQGVIQVPPLRRLGYQYRPGLDFRSPGMKKVFALMGPVMVSTWVQPINLVINSRFGSRAIRGAGVSAMEYSTNLYLVIAGTFILSITNVIFPKLSRLTAGGQQGDFRDTLRQTVHSSLFFVLPMAAGLMAVARPLVSFLYGGGEFGQPGSGSHRQRRPGYPWAWPGLCASEYSKPGLLRSAAGERAPGSGRPSIGVNLLLCMALVGRWRSGAGHRLRGLLHGVRTAADRSHGAGRSGIPGPGPVPGLLQNAGFRRGYGADRLAAFGMAWIGPACRKDGGAALPGPVRRRLAWRLFRRYPVHGHGGGCMTAALIKRLLKRG